MVTSEVLVLAVGELRELGGAWRWAAIFGLTLPLLNAAVADRAGPAQRGRYMGLYTMAYSVAFVIAPGAGAWVYDGYGPDVLWLALGALAVPLAALASILRRPFRTP